jgi:hypothetical protein
MTANDDVRMESARAVARSPWGRPETRTGGVGRAAMLAMAVAVACSLAVLASADQAPAAGPPAFATPEEAARALIEIVKANDVSGLLVLFGPDAQDVVDTSDVATGRRNREVFLAAIAEGWRLADAAPDRKELVAGNEDWPFPVPLVRRAAGWSFDAAAGREEILNRRIGRNELAVIEDLRTYVGGQRAYARTAHDGKPAGLFARRFASEPGKQNGLYWSTGRGERRSPLGDLIAEAAAEGYRGKEAGQGPSALHGYYFRILEGQGKGAKGGAIEYVVNGEMSGGFALVAWPAHYDASGIMTFVVNQDGVAYEKDLGPETTALVEAITRYNPDDTWRQVLRESARKP